MATPIILLPRRAKSRAVPTYFDLSHRPCTLFCVADTQARDLPPTTAPGLYSEMVAEAEAASRERRSQRRTVPVPFSFASRETRQGRKLDEMGRQPDENMPYGIDERDVGASADGPTWTEKGQTVGQRQSFKARDVPRSMSEPRWEMMRVQESERRERVAQEALKSAQVRVAGTSIRQSPLGHPSPS